MVVMAVFWSPANVAVMRLYVTRLYWSFVSNATVHFLCLLKEQGGMLGFDECYAVPLIHNFPQDLGFANRCSSDHGIF
jgi:hypothetical protein